MANTLKLSRNGAVGFIDWLGLSSVERYVMAANYLDVSQLPLPFHSVENQELFGLVVGRRQPPV